MLVSFTSFLPSLPTPQSRLSHPLYCASWPPATCPCTGLEPSPPLSSITPVFETTQVLSPQAAFPALTPAQALALGEEHTASEFANYHCGSVRWKLPIGCVICPLACGQLQDKNSAAVPFRLITRKSPSPNQQLFIYFCVRPLHAS